MFVYKSQPGRSPPLDFCTCAKTALISLNIHIMIEIYVQAAVSCSTPYNKLKRTHNPCAEYFFLEKETRNVVKPKDFEKDQSRKVLPLCKTMANQLFGNSDAVMFCKLGPYQLLGNSDAVMFCKFRPR